MVLQVIGAGLARTGTMSLKLALEQLGYGPCFHMVEMLKEPTQLQFLDVDHPQGCRDWDQFFDGYQSTTDYPACLYYQELLALNPDAKVILTVRDADSWYESVKNTVYRGKPKGASDIFRLMKNMIFSADMRRTAPVFMYNDKLIWRGHFENQFDDKAYAIEVFNRHIEEVKAHVPPAQLLVFDVKDGWEPLCQFLNCLIPGTPFPKSNEKTEFNRKMDRLLIDGIFEP